MNGKTMLRATEAMYDLPYMVDIMIGMRHNLQVIENKALTGGQI